MWKLLGSVKLPNSVAQVWDYFRDPLSNVTFEKWLIEALARLRTYRVLLAGWRCGVLRELSPLLEKRDSDNSVLGAGHELLVDTAG